MCMGKLQWTCLPALSLFSDLSIYLYIHLSIYLPIYLSSYTCRENRHGQFTSAATVAALTKKGFGGILYYN